MAHLVVLHRHDDRARAQVARRQAFQVPGQMRLDLPLGLGHEAQAEPVAGAPGRQPQQQRAAIPERSEQRRPGAQLAQSLARPGQMVAFLARGLAELARQSRVGGRSGLAFVERLRAELADVVDAHQRGRQMPGCRFGRLGRIAPGDRQRPARPAHAGQRRQRPAEARKAPIQRRLAAQPGGRFRVHRCVDFPA